jgi:hypothetical protein
MFTSNAVLLFLFADPHRQNLHGRQARVETLQWENHAGH